MAGVPPLRPGQSAQAASARTIPLSGKSHTQPEVREKAPIRKPPGGPLDAKPPSTGELTGLGAATGRHLTGSRITASGCDAGPP